MMNGEILQMTSRKSSPLWMRSWLILNIFFMTLSVALIALGLGFYYAKVSPALNTLKTNQQKMENIQSSQLTQLADWQRVSEKVDATAFALQAQGQQLRQLSLLQQQKQARLETIANLVNLARMYLIATEDVKTAERLLAQAQQIVFSAKDPSFQDLAKAIEKDRALLQKIASEDVSSLFMQVFELERSIDDMPLLGSSFATAEESIDEEQSPVAHGWRAHIKENLQALKALIVIRKEKDPLLPLIAKEQGEYINQYIHMQLSMAQWALLHRDLSVYQASLDQAMLWVNRYYVILNPKTQAFLNSLSKLRAASFDFPQGNLANTILALAALNQSI